MTAATAIPALDDLRRLPDIVSRSARRFADRVALASAQGGPALTFTEVHERVRRAAGALRARDLRPGDRVLLALDGSPDWAVAFFAILEADLVAVPVPAQLAPGLAALAARHAEVRAVVGSDRPLHDLLADLPSLMPSELAAGSAGAVGPCAAPETTAVLVFTSGSTARPRAVELSHGNLIANLRSLMSGRHARPGETLLSTLPPSHAYELVGGQMAAVLSGARLVYAGAPLPNRLLDAMRDQGITRALVVPALLEALGREVATGVAEQGLIDPSWCNLDAAGLARRLRQCDGSCRARLLGAVRDRIGFGLDTLVVGGAALDPAWTEILRTFGIDLELGYGLTEAGPLVSVGLGSESPPGSVGRPLAGVEVRVDDRGEVLVRSGGVMRGYLKDPDATAAALHGGWLHTGDRGRLDAQGFLFITGRIKEAIVTAAGETIYPEEIEPYYASRLFAEHCVVPLAGPDGNDRPVLVIVPSQPDMPDGTIERVVAGLRAAAPSRCRIEATVRRDAALPRSALGKFRRRVLAEELGRDRLARDGAGS